MSWIKSLTCVHFIFEWESWFYPFRELFFTVCQRQLEWNSTEVFGDQWNKNLKIQIKFSIIIVGDFNRILSEFDQADKIK